MNRKPEAENEEEEDLEVEEVDSDEWEEDDEDLVIDVLLSSGRFRIVEHLTFCYFKSTWGYAYLEVLKIQC